MTSQAHTKSNNLFGLLILCLLGLFVIFFRFAEVPKNLTFDEIEFAKLALSLENTPYSPYSQLATGHATLYFYILLISLKLFGISSFALRLPSALFGFAAIILFFFVIRKVVHKWGDHHSSFILQVLPFLGMFMFITTRWFFNFARFGFEATFLLFLELFSLLFFLYYLDHKQNKWLIYAGVFAGLAYNSYQPGRLFFIIPIIMLFFHILESKSNRSDFSFFSKHVVGTFLSFLIPFVILITPLTLYLSQNKDLRLNQLMYINNEELSPVEKVQYLGSTISSTAMMFSVKGDVNGRHNYPNKAALNPIMSVLFMGGVFLAMHGIKNKMNQLFILYFCIAVFPTLLTNPWENPNMLRTITCLPSLIYFCTLSLMWGYTFIEKKVGGNYKVALICAVVLISVSALYDLRTYYVFQQPVFEQAFEATMPLPYYIEHPGIHEK